MYMILYKKKENAPVYIYIQLKKVQQDKTDSLIKQNRLQYRGHVCLIMWFYSVYLVS